MPDIQLPYQESRSNVLYNLSEASVSNNFIDLVKTQSQLSGFFFFNLLFISPHVSLLRTRKVYTTAPPLS